MKRISQKAIEQLTSDMRKAASNGSSTWDPWHDEHYQSVVLDIPSGELMNERITGFLWAWAMQKNLQSMRLAKSDRLNANGLEGKIRIRTFLISALLACQELPKYRYQLFYS